MSGPVLYRRLDVIVFAIFSFFAAALIIAFPQEIKMDQNFTVFRFSTSGYPTFDYGMVANMLMGIHNALIPTTGKTLNTFARLYGMFFFCGAAFLLARRVLKNALWVCAFLILVFTSRLPFLWLTSELFAGAFLALAIRFLLERDKKNVRLAAVFLVLAGLTKPDLIAVSGALFLFGIWNYRKTKELKTFVGFYSATLAAFIVPGLIIHKSAFLGSRAFGAFMQHYADLVFRHQVMKNAPDPWMLSERYVEATFPGAQSLAQLILKYPSQYMDYLGLSLTKLLKNSMRLFNFLVVLIPLRLLWIRLFSKLDRVEAMFYFSLLGLLPSVAASYPHVRYLARYYPIIVVALLYALLKASQVSGVNRGHKKIAMQVSYGLLSLAVATQFYFTARLIQEMSVNPGPVWFPD